MEDVFRLIRNKADPLEVKKALKGKDMTFKDKSNQTILHYTCLEGLHDVVVYALKKGVPVNDADRNGWTALHCAASGGHLRICELLMKEGANPVASSSDGGTPLHYLVRIPWDPAHSPKVFSPLLVKQMGDVNAIVNQQEESPLHQASLKGSEECVAFLLEQKADPNQRTKLGETPLHFGIRSGRTSIVRLLFEYGADATIAGNQGNCLKLAQEVTNIHGMLNEVEDGIYSLLYLFYDFILYSVKFGLRIGKGQARNNTRKDVNKVYKKGSINKSGGTKGRKGFKKTWVIVDGKSVVTAPSETETSTSQVESFFFRDISTIIIEDQPAFTFTVTLKDGTKWSLTADDRVDMAKWLFAIDGLKHRGFNSSMDTHLKKTMLQQVYKEGFKGGIVKSSFDEEWAYGPDGTVQCTEGWTGPEFMWDGVELISKSGLGKKDPIGWGRFNGFIYEWVDVDGRAVRRYWAEEIDREYHCTDPQLTWKWTRHFLALKHGTGEWIVENFVPEPVVFFLSLIRYRRQDMKGSA